MDPKQLQTFLPIIIIAVVFALRFRSLNKPRPFNLRRLWISPAIMLALVLVVLVSFPPTGLGWLAVLAGLAIGAVAGIKRGQLMQLERDPVTGKLLIRQSPAALLFVIAIFAVRRLIAFETGTDNAATVGPGGQIPPQALLVTDGLIAFAFAMVLLLRWTLWQRAQAIPAHEPIAAAPASAESGV